MLPEGSLQRGVRFADVFGGDVAAEVQTLQFVGDAQRRGMARERIEYQFPWLCSKLDAAPWQFVGETGAMVTLSADRRKGPNGSYIQYLVRPIGRKRIVPVALRFG